MECAVREIVGSTPCEVPVLPSFLVCSRFNGPQFSSLIGMRNWGSSVVDANRGSSFATTILYGGQTGLNERCG